MARVLVDAKITMMVILSYGCIMTRVLVDAKIMMDIAEQHDAGQYQLTTSCN